MLTFTEEDHSSRSKY